MSKRSVAFIKPEEPSFLKKLKAQVGYQEGPTIDTKREELEISDDKDLEDNDEEKPTVVVLKAGDLTAEEAAAEEDRLQKESANAPADLSKPIMFKVPEKKTVYNERDEKHKIKQKSRNSKRVLDKRLLSFDNEEDDDS